MSASASRRHIVRTGAWTLPALLTATAAPAASASAPPVSAPRPQRKPAAPVVLGVHGPLGAQTRSWSNSSLPNVMDFSVRLANLGETAAPAGSRISVGIDSSSFELAVHGRPHDRVFDFPEITVTGSGPGLRPLASRTQTSGRGIVSHWSDYETLAPVLPGQVFEIEFQSVVRRLPRGEFFSSFRPYAVFQLGPVHGAEGLSASQKGASVRVDFRS